MLDRTEICNSNEHSDVKRIAYKNHLKELLHDEKLVVRQIYIQESPE